MRVLQNPHVDATDFLRNGWFLRRIGRDFELKRSVPAASGFALDDDTFHGSVVGEVAVGNNGYVANLVEVQDVLATRFLEFETRLIVLEGLIVPFTLPFEFADLVAFFSSSKG